MHFRTDKPLNEIKINGETVMNMEVGNGWTITDVWFDHDVPAELIDCIKVKFERTQGEQVMTLEEAILHYEEVATCSKGNCANEHRQLAEWLKELRERRAKDKPIEYTELCFFCNQKGTDHCNKCSVRRAYEKIAEDDDNYIEPQTERHLPDYSYEADLGRRIMEQTERNER